MTPDDLTQRADAAAAHAEALGRAWADLPWWRPIARHRAAAAFADALEAVRVAELARVKARRAYEPLPTGDGDRAANLKAEVMKGGGLPPVAVRGGLLSQAPIPPDVTAPPKPGDYVDPQPVYVWPEAEIRNLPLSMTPLDPIDATERLAAALARIEELTAEHAALQDEVERTWRYRNELETQRARLLDHAARALERTQVAADPSGAADEATAILEQVVTLDGTYVPK